MALKLSFKAASLPIEIEGETGLENYELREMAASARDRYLDAMADRIQIVDGKPSGIRKFDGMQAELLTRCLYKEGKLVEKAVIQAWPSTLVAQLFDEAQKLNSLTTADKPATEKNE